MQFRRIFINLLAILVLQTVFICPINASNILDEIDTLRAELSYLKDKNSPNYVKTKHKLTKLINKSKIDYSEYARFQDIERLFIQQKYSTALYELNELNEIGYEVSRCHEIMGDIAYRQKKSPRDVAKYYKQAIQEDSSNVSAKYKLAKLYLINKKNIIAIEYLKQTIDNTQDIVLLEEIAKIIQENITPKNRYEANNLYEILGDIYIKLGQKKYAFEAYIKALRLNPKDIFIKYNLAYEFYLENITKDTIEIINSILIENPYDNQIKTTKAKSLLKENRKEEALEVYRDILTINPYSMQAKYGIYEIYKNNLNPEEILRKLYKKPKNSEITKEELLSFASFLKEMRDIEGMQVFSQYAYELQKQKTEELLKEKIKLEQEKIKKQEAKKQEIKKTVPKKPVAKKEEIKKTEVKKAEIKKPEVKKTEPKKTEVKKAKIKKPGPKKPEVKKTEPKKQEIKKQPATISTNDKKLIEIETKKSKAKNIKKYQNFKTTVDKYLKIEPKTAEIYMAIANTYKQMEIPTQALVYYEKAKQLEPTNSDIYYNIGLTKLEKNDSIGAKTNLVKSINLNNENTKAINLLKFVNQKIITHTLNESYTKFEKKDYIKAFEILDKGIKEYPNNAQLYYYRALIYEKMNRNAASIIDLQKAIEFDPTHYMAYYHLGKVYEKIKDERSALVAYEKFLSIEPDEKELIDEIQKKVVSLGAKYY